MSECVCVVLMLVLVLTLTLLCCAVQKVRPAHLRQWHGRWKAPQAHIWGDV